MGLVNITWTFTQRWDNWGEVACNSLVWFRFEYLQRQRFHRPSGKLYQCVTNFMVKKFVSILSFYSGSPQTSCAPAPCSSLWPSIGFASVFPCLSCHGDAKTVRSTPVLVSQELNRREESLPLTYWLHCC